MLIIVFLFLYTLVIKVGYVLITVLFVSFLLYTLDMEVENLLIIYIYTNVFSVDNRVVRIYFCQTDCVMLL